MAYERAAKSRNLPLPGASEAEVVVDAPALLPLVYLCPSVLIYTRSAASFRAVWLSPTCRYSEDPLAIVCHVRRRRSHTCCGWLAGWRPSRRRGRG